MSDTPALLRVNDSPTKTPSKDCNIWFDSGVLAAADNHAFHAMRLGPTAEPPTRALYAHNPKPAKRVRLHRSHCEQYRYSRTEACLLPNLAICFIGVTELDLVRLVVSDCETLHPRMRQGLF